MLNDAFILKLAVTSPDGGNGDGGRKMPKKRKILEDKKKDFDLYCRLQEVGRISGAWRG